MAAQDLSIIFFNLSLSVSLYPPFYVFYLFLFQLINLIFEWLKAFIMTFYLNVKIFWFIPGNSIPSPFQLIYWWESTILPIPLFAWWFYLKVWTQLFPFSSASKNRQKRRCFFFDMNWRSRDLKLWKKLDPNVNQGMNLYLFLFLRGETGALSPTLPPFFLGICWLMERKVNLIVIFF